MLHQQLESPQSLDLPCATNLYQKFFPLDVLAHSKGQGIGRVKQGDARPPLDKDKTKTLKRKLNKEDLTRNLLSRTFGFDKPTEQQLNDAITERISYARKQLRSKQHNK